MKKLAVHLHLYYENQLPSLVCMLMRSGISDRADFFITYPGFRNDLARAALSLKKCLRSLHCIPVPNEGYDIGPFIKVVKGLDLKKYDYVLKIHTKGRSRSWNYTRLGDRLVSDAMWTDMLVDALIGSEKAFRGALEAFTDPHIGMVAAETCIVGDNPIRAEIIKAGVKRELESRFSLRGHWDGRFVAGTMFMIRASLLTPLQTADTPLFAPSQSFEKDYTLAHIYERLFSALVTAQGFRLHGLKVRRYPIETVLVQCGVVARALYARALRLFLYARALMTIIKDKNIRRAISPMDVALVSNSKFFDAAWYRSYYGGSLERIDFPAVHYVTEGWKEGKRPSEFFFGEDFLRANPDAAGRCPLVFYERIARFENRVVGTGSPE
jgi:hypothetical protein